MQNAQKGPCCPRSSPPLPLSLPVTHYEIILRRIAVCTPHLPRRARARAEQIWTASLSFSFLDRPRSLARRPTHSCVLPAFVLVFVCIIVDFGRPLASMKGRMDGRAEERRDGRMDGRRGRRLTANLVRRGLGILR